jgi:hypothetical protein
MNTAEALDSVSKIYIPGAADFYGKVPGDPWMKAHEDFEAAIRTGKPEIKRPAAERFVDRIRELLEAYRKMGHASPQLSLLDSVNLGQPHHAVVDSAKYKVCIRCESSKKSLIPQADPLNPGRVYLICRECKGDAR